MSLSEMAAGALHETEPTTADEARFSLPYLLGRAVLDGTVGFDSFEPAALHDPPVRTVTECVRMHVESRRGVSALQTTVELTTSGSGAYRLLEAISERESSRSLVAQL